MPRISSSVIDRSSASQLKTLLGLGARPPADPGSLPAQATKPEELSLVLTELCQSQDKSGDVLFSTICTAATPLETLRGIKDLAKNLLGTARIEPHRDAATFLYHATVAAAFARYGVNISSIPMERRLTLYEDLAVALAGHPVGGVFREALCRIEP
jgi:hypothetical protein